MEEVIKIFISSHLDSISYELLKSDLDIPKFLKRKSLQTYSITERRTRERGLIIADTKFEFGFYDGNIILIDEVLIPDSSRFWSAEHYERVKVKLVLINNLLETTLKKLGGIKNHPLLNCL